MFVDIHTHKSSNSVYPAIRNLTFVEAENLFLSNEKGLFSAGFHPWHADEFSANSFSNLEKWVNDNRFVAIGECGLDKNSQVSLEKQILVFEKQISLSEEVQKPLIIHCVGCFNELLKLKKEHNPHQRWIIHGFRGKPELANQILNSGCSLSFGEHFNTESVFITPLDKLFIETDESSMPINEIFNLISKIKGCNTEALYAGETLIKSFSIVSK
ncbi:MAG: TatD family hydrolase [Paludibacter sp.]|nr:TatD family hydrolase [Paludibacter sp.]